MARAPYTYEICVAKPADTSMLIKNERSGIADTTIAFLSGLVTEKRNKAPLPCGYLALTDEATGQTYDRSINENGHYSIEAPSGTYRLKVVNVSFADLDTSITLGSGEIREVDVAMGQGPGYVMFSI